MENFCQFYYPPSADFQRGPCPLFVRGLFKLLDQVDPVHHCDQIGACGPNNERAPLAGLGRPSGELALMTPKQADVVCKFCEQSVEQVRAALSDPQLVSQIRTQVDQFCDYLKVVDADKECRQLADKYLDQALDFVRNIDPQAYCRSVRLCAPPAQHRSAAAPNSRLLPLPTLADFRGFGLETSVTIGQNEQQAGAGPNCVLCKTIVKEMFHFLRNNRTEANIIKGLDRVCSLVFPPGSSNLDECQSMVKAYTRELVQLFVDETDPEMICVLLEQCVSRSAPFAPKYSVQAVPVSDDKQQQQQHQKPSVAPPIRSLNLGELIHSLDPTTKLKSAKICFECKMFIKYLRSVFDEPSSREAIKGWLVQNLCQSIPDKETSLECKNLVDQYSDTFFAAVIGGLNPSAACVELGACARGSMGQVLHIDTLAPFWRSDELPTLIVSPKMATSSATKSHRLEAARKQEQAAHERRCLNCLEIYNRIDEHLASQPMGDDVASLKQRVCQTSFADHKLADCDQMIDEHGVEIVHSVSTMEDSRTVCNNIFQCKLPLVA